MHPWQKATTTNVPMNVRIPWPYQYRQAAGKKAAPVVSPRPSPIGCPEGPDRETRRSEPRRGHEVRHHALACGPETAGDPVAQSVRGGIAKDQVHPDLGAHPEVEVRARLLLVQAVEGAAVVGEDVAR